MLNSFMDHLEDFKGRDVRIHRKTEDIKGRCVDVRASWGDSIYFIIDVGRERRLMKMRNIEDISYTRPEPRPEEVIV